MLLRRSIVRCTSVTSSLNRKIINHRGHSHDELDAADMQASSRSRAEARKRVRSLYRKIVRDMPRLLNAFDLDHRYPELYYEKIKARFYEHKDVKDIRYIDILRQQGEMDYQEAVNMWSTKSHINAYAKAHPSELIQTKYDSDEPVQKDQSQFLTDFLK